MTAAKQCVTHRTLPSLRGLKFREWMLAINRMSGADLESPVDVEWLKQMAAEWKERAPDDEKAAEAERNKMLESLSAAQARLMTSLTDESRLKRRGARARLRDVEKHIESIRRSHWTDIQCFRFCPVVLNAMTDEFVGAKGGVR